MRASGSHRWYIRQHLAVAPRDENTRHNSRTRGSFRRTMPETITPISHYSPPLIPRGIAGNSNKTRCRGTIGRRCNCAPRCGGRCSYVQRALDYMLQSRFRRRSSKDGDDGRGEKARETARCRSSDLSQIALCFVRHCRLCFEVTK